MCILQTTFLKQLFGERTILNFLESLILTIITLLRRYLVRKFDALTVQLIREGSVDHSKDIVGEEPILC